MFLKFFFFKSDFLLVFENLTSVYIFSETFYRANLKNKAITASVYGQNLVSKFQGPELENFCHFYKLHRYVLFFCFVHKFQNANLFPFVSEAEHVLALFLSFGQIESQCSDKEKKRGLKFHPFSPPYSHWSIQKNCRLLQDRRKQ